MKHLNYLGVIVTFFYTLFLPLNAQVSLGDIDYEIRPLFELDQAATGEAYPWISDDGLRIYYTAYNELDSVFSIWYSERSSQTTTFDAHYLLEINSPFDDNLSAWLSSDETTICFARRCHKPDIDTEIYIATRESKEALFNNPRALRLPERFKGTFLSPSFTPDLKQLILFNEYKGHSYILIFEQANDLTYTFKSQLQFPDRFRVKSGKLSNDGLEYYISLEEGRRKPSLFMLSRNSIDENFTAVDKILSTIINHPDSRNHQAHFSANKSYAVFTQSSINDWDSNSIYIARDRTQPHQTLKGKTLLTGALDNIILFPNPSVDHIYFRNTDGKDIHVTLFDASGQRVRVLSQIKDNELVNISDLTPGTYYFKITDISTRAFRIIKHIKL